MSSPVKNNPADQSQYTQLNKETEKKTSQNPNTNPTEKKVQEAVKKRAPCPACGMG